METKNTALYEGIADEWLETEGLSRHTSRVKSLGELLDTAVKAQMGYALQRIEEKMGRESAAVICALMLPDAEA